MAISQEKTAAIGNHQLALPRDQRVLGIVNVGFRTLQQQSKNERVLCFVFVLCLKSDKLRLVGRNLI